MWQNSLKNNNKNTTGTPTFSNHHLISQQPVTLRKQPPPAKILQLSEGSEDA